jgi:hypothetical protein
MLFGTKIFASGEICLSRSEFRCVRAIFYAQVGPVRIRQKSIGTGNAGLVFYHPLGSAGHVVHSVASGARNIDVLFFIIGRAWCGFYKKHTGTRYSELVF